MGIIFGEEHFIDKTMVKFYQMQEGLIINNLEDCAKEIKFNYDIVVDKEKLRKWLILCIRLENIDQSTLIDMATKKKFAEKDEEIEILKRTLMNTCNDLLIEIGSFDNIKEEMKRQIERTKKQIEKENNNEGNNF